MTPRLWGTAMNLLMRATLGVGCEDTTVLDVITQDQSIGRRSIFCLAEEGNACPDMSVFRKLCNVCEDSRKPKSNAVGVASPGFVAWPHRSRRGNWRRTVGRKLLVLAVLVLASVIVALAAGILQVVAGGRVIRAVQSGGAAFVTAMTLGMLVATWLGQM